MHTPQQVARAVASALDASAANVERVHPSCWTYELENGKVFPGTACIEGRWLALEAAPQAGDGPESWCPWRALRTGSELWGLAKVALSDDAPVVRADFPLSSEPGPDLAGVIRDTCRAMESAAYAFLPPDSATNPAELPFEANAVDTPGDLARRVEETGWPHAKRSDGTVAVELGIPHPRFEATVGHDRGRNVWVRARIARFAELSGTSRRALGRFLLEANAGVRLARATAFDSTDGIEVAFEARLPSEAAADQLGHALSAVTVAAATWGVETRALSIEHLASRFLAARADAGRRSTTRSARKSRR